MMYLMDYYLVEPLPPSLANGTSSHVGKTVVITGGNSGMGFETARQLAVTYGMNVVLGCRSKVKCDYAAQLINDEIIRSNNDGSGGNDYSNEAKAIPHIIDLADFTSVSSFVDNLKGLNIDVLYNNAGYAPEANQPVDQYGLDPSFTSMHLSHFYLTEELLKQNPRLRVVNTSSETHHICAIPFTLLPNWMLDRILPSITHNPGCVDEDYLRDGMYTPTDSASYITAKIANVMHAVEIPLHHPEATAVAIDLGWVGTSIQSFMEGLLSPTNLGWMRSVKVGVLPALHAILSSDEALLLTSGEKNNNNRRWNKEGGVVMNVFGRTEEAFAIRWIWKEKDGLGRSRMLELSRSLWKTSEGLIEKHVNASQ